MFVTSDYSYMCLVHNTHFREYYYEKLIAITHIMLNRFFDSDFHYRDHTLVLLLNPVVLVARLVNYNRVELN